jgi:hypothetical protein
MAHAGGSLAQRTPRTRVTEQGPSAALAFLRTLWSNQPDAIATLQETVGYVLIPDTSQQKVFLLVGPARSDKGTIARMLNEIVARTTPAPALRSLGDDFELEPLIGTPLSRHPKRYAWSTQRNTGRCGRSSIGTL